MCGRILKLRCPDVLTNSLVVADGQTGSGKTWSMTGADGDNRGIIPRMCTTLFERIEKEKQGAPTKSGGTPRHWDTPWWAIWSTAILPTTRAMVCT